MLCVRQNAIKHNAIARVLLYHPQPVWYNATMTAAAELSRNRIMKEDFSVTEYNFEEKLGGLWGTGNFPWELVAILGVVLLVLGIIGLILYILMSVGLMRMAQRRGIENAWLAWIPIANMYILGKLVKEISIFEIKISNLELILPVGSLVIGALSAIPLVGWAAGLAWLILNIAVMYHLYRMYRPDSATLYTVLSVIFAFLIPVFIFIMRHDTLLELPETLIPAAGSDPGNPYSGSQSNGEGSPPAGS